MRRLLPLLLLSALLGCDVLNPPQIDLDGDGYPPEEDCDDNDAAVNPGVGERCDGKDNDCDGATDEGFDEDGDGAPPCGPFPDCDDSDPAVFPGAPEICNGIDDDCNGVTDDGTTGTTDADGDGVSGCDGDCDDSDPSVFPGAPEICDGLDNDCDGVLGAAEVDADGDGAVGCPGVDCDDGDPSIFPGAVELCDQVDQDCDGLIDELFDADGDGVSTCANPVDCDDGDPAVFPGAPELCDGDDNDCDGIVDEDTGIDSDGDGVSACGGDCNDNDPFIYPGGFEHPNGADDDCDGQVDEGWSGLGNAGALEPVMVGGATLEARAARLSEGGDFNGDGRSDFVASNPSYGGGAGRAWLYLGTGFSVSNPPATLSAISTVSGASGDALGDSAALADLDGDGFDDLIIGAPESNSPSPPNGKVYVRWGSPLVTGGDWPTASAAVTIAGSASTEQCGSVVANAGDVNGDGRDDLLIGCPWFDPGGAGSGLRGRTLLFLGRTRAQWATVTNANQASAQWVGSTAETLTPSALASAGDQNGDGRADFLIGSRSHTNNNGRACLVLGQAGAYAASASLDAASRCWTGASGQQAGAFVGGGGKNGDAYDDMLIGGPASNGGRGYLALLIGGPTPWGSGPLATRWEYIVFGSVASEEAGADGAFADLDGDGLSEVIAPTLGYDGPLGGDQGRVAILPGPDSLYPSVVDPGDAPILIEGEAGGDGFGTTVAALADFNGDGAEDVVVGSPWSDLGAPGGGALYILLGAP